MEHAIMSPVPSPPSPTTSAEELMLKEETERAPVARLARGEQYGGLTPH
jgi:hypothetical protein